MRGYSPNSLLTSVALHACAAGAIFLTTLYLTQPEKVQPVIFELVTGPATAPDELQAPALGNTLEKVTLDIPQVAAAPEPPVEEAVPEPPAPPAPRPPEPKVVKKATVHEAAKPKPDDSLEKEMKRSARISYRDYMKKHPTPKPVAPVEPRPAAKVPRIDTQGIAGGVRGGSTANTRGGGGGNALTREEHNQLDTYISLLKQELKNAHEPPPGVSESMEAKVTFEITASGVILNPRISKTSGDAAFDASVLEAFRKVRSIGPNPNHQSETWTLVFRMRDLE